MGYDMYVVGEPEGTEGNYFRLNIGGMHLYRQVMAKFGMLTHLDLDLDWLRGEGWKEVPEPDVVPEPVGGIPIYKFASNDGWWVSPQEIGKALETYDSLDERAKGVVLLAHLDGGRDYWNEWITFLRVAQEKGGFEVL